MCPFTTRFTTDQETKTNPKDEFKIIPGAYYLASSWSGAAAAGLTGSGTSADPKPASVRQTGFRMGDPELRRLSAWSLDLCEWRC